MISLRFESVSGVLATFLTLFVMVVPTYAESPVTIVPRAVPPAPRFVIYTDKGPTGPPAVSDLAGYNVLVLSFLLSSGAADQAQAWAQKSDSERSTIKGQYSAAGISIIVSLFGSTETPTTSGADPVDTANKMAAWVKQYNLDGVDVDYEDFQAMNVGDGKAEKWLTSFTQQLRTQLPQGSYILTHAPVATWFSPKKFGGGAYLNVNSAVGNLIDWYNLQFYNQGPTEYTTCDNMLTTSSDGWPNSAVFQIAASGVPLSKLVIGKPATEGDASNGFMSTDTFATCLAQANSKGWDAGVMVWEFPDANAAWIQNTRGATFPYKKSGNSQAGLLAPRNVSSGIVCSLPGTAAT